MTFFGLSKRIKERLDYFECGELAWANLSLKSQLNV
jgi:hypothetical protein